MTKDKPEKKFLQCGRREFMQLGLFGAVTVAGTIFKKTYLDPIPGFSDMEFTEAIKNESKGLVVWDPEYTLEFVNKYIDGAKWFQKKTGSRAFDVITAHPFPIQKYELTRKRSLDDKILTSQDFASTKPISMSDLALVHSKGHILKLYLMSYSYTGLLNGENPLMPEMPNYVKTAAGGTYTAGNLALENGVAMNLNGGFHHAMPDHESGFCYINDVAIAVKKLLSEKKIKSAMIVDMDIHHGDGNAAIMAPDPRVSLFDVYQENNFPEKKYPVEYAVPINTSKSKIRVKDDFYMEKIQGLKGAIKKENPDLIFYLAGSDPHHNDMLGGFELTTQGLKDRDEYVLSSAKRLGKPIAVVTAGGYPRDIKDAVDIHTNTVALVKKYS